MTPLLRGSAGGDFYVRAQLAQLRVNELMAASRATTDVERLRAISDEMELIVGNLRELRREQLMRELEPPAPRRPWWRRLAGGSAENDQRERAL